MLMDRMGILVPAPEESRELEVAATTEDEFLLDIQIAQAVGCIIMRSRPDLISQQHIAVHPESGGLSLWWTGLAAVEQIRPELKTEGLVATMKTRGVGRVDGLQYGGLQRRRDSRLPFLQRFNHEDLGAEDVKSGDKVELRGPAAQSFQSHVIHTVEYPSA